MNRRTPHPSTAGERTPAKPLSALAALAVVTALLSLGSIGVSATHSMPSPPAAPYYADSDRDGIPDLLDSCPAMDNLSTGAIDSDGDRLIDACDLDPGNVGAVTPAWQPR